MKKLLFLSLFCIIYAPMMAQQATISIDKTEVALNEPLQISANMTNGRLTQCGNFPDIAGFDRSVRSSSSHTSIVNGVMSSTESIIQYYNAKKEGTYTIPPFTMTINGQNVRFAGAKVKVGPSQQATDPFDAFWGVTRRNEPEEYWNLKADAFFAVNTSHNAVYAGEGFNLNISFYFGENNQANLDFSEDISQQLAEILKKVKPKNCWEENFGIDYLMPQVVNLGGKRYRQYKIYEANYYPLNTDPIEIPSVALDMVEYKISKNISFFGLNQKKEKKTFHSQARKIVVKPLPPHPLRDQVAVGNYQLGEKLSERNLQTGKSFSYHFQIKGEGNISAINKPTLPTNTNFDFYDPNIQQQINRNQGTVYGTKTFSYMAVPKEPGNYKLDEQFKWIYFNPQMGRYDTLRSQLNVNVKGESIKNSALEASDLGDYYELIKNADNDLMSIHKDGFFTIFANTMLLLILGTTFWIAFKKK
jgi:BatD DUF11 like domain